MSKHNGIALAGLILALAALSPPLASGKARGTDRPVRGTAVGTVSVKVQGLVVTADVTGVAAHLGKYSGHFEGSGAITPQGTVAGGGTGAFVAANGDELTGTFTFAGPLPSGAVHPVTVVATISGGTGRFEAASGTLTSALLATPSFFNGVSLVETVEGRVTGRLSY